MYGQPSPACDTSERATVTNGQLAAELERTRGQRNVCAAYNATHNRFIQEAKAREASAKAAKKI